MKAGRCVRLRLLKYREGLKEGGTKGGVWLCSRTGEMVIGGTDNLRAFNSGWERVSPGSNCKPQEKDEKANAG